MKKITLLTLIIFMCGIYAQATTYLISSKATNSGATITHNGMTFTVGTTAFADFNSFLSSSIASNSTVYVADGTYSGNITIATEGLKILGNNAYRDWTATRAAESIITGTIYIKASNVTINGFKFTGAGRIESTAGTNAAPLSGIKVMYNYFTGSTVTRSSASPLVEIGNAITNADANTTASQCRYKNCEVSHNHFEGDATHYPNCVGFGGAFGTTTISDNYFYDGGTSVHLDNSQGDLNVEHNKFKKVGVSTASAPDGGSKGDFCIYAMRCAYSNSTNLNIKHNEFDECYGQESFFSLIRIYPGASGSDACITPVNMSVSINHNTIKNKTSLSANSGQLNENMLLYADKGTTSAIKFNLADNHFDNRFYKFSWVTLADGIGQREVYSNAYDQFLVGGKYSTMGTSIITGTDISNHAKNVSLASVTVLQSMDIDMKTGDMYFLQLLGTSENDSFCSSYGLSSSNCDGLRLTRVICTKKGTASDPTYTYSGTQSMRIAKSGHGVKLSVCRDKNGQLWMITGGKGSDNGTSNDLSGTSISRFKFVSGGVRVLNGSGSTDSSVEYFEHPEGLSNAYGAVDEMNRYICISSSGGGRKYYIYDLDEYLEGKTNPTQLGYVKLTDGADPITGTGLSKDSGFETWSYQSYAINGDYLYLLEGESQETSNPVTSGDPIVVLSTYNWRTGQFLRRDRINYARINDTFGEPEAFTVRPDEYGNVCAYLGIAVGASGSRKANIFKYHIDRHLDSSGAVIGDDTNTGAQHFNTSQYSGITMTPSATSISLSAASTSETPSQTITIKRSTKYLYGNWTGTITGADGEVFDVAITDNTPFTSSFKATVTFKPNGNKSSYSANLRLSSPSASDIIIPINATYTGSTGDTPATPTIKASTSSVSLSTEVGTATSKSITIEGLALTGNITLALSGTDASQFSINPSSLSSVGGNVTITYNPSNDGTHNATLTASSTGADNVSITLSGTATKAPEVITGYKLTQDWAQTSGHLTAGTNTRWATGFDGKIYINDHANSMLYYWTANGLTNTNIASAAGTAITSDDAGNIIVSTSMYAGGNTAMKVLPANGTAFQDLTLTMPDGVTANQMQYLGKAIGNIMSADGGAIFIFPKDATSVAKIIIKNGVQTSANKIDVTAITADAQSIAIPLTNDINSNDIVARVRSANHFYYNNGTGFVAYPDNGINTTQGGTIFTLNGTLYNVQPIGSTAYLDGFQIVDVTNNTIVATHEAQFTTAAVAPNPNCITAEVVGQYEAKLYQYVPGQLAAQYTFSLQTSGIENVMIGNKAEMSLAINGNILQVVGINAISTALYSINGSMVTYDTDNTLDVAGLKGVFIVIAKTADGTPYTSKVIIK